MRSILKSTNRVGEFSSFTGAHTWIIRRQHKPVRRWVAMCRDDPSISFVTAPTLIELSGCIARVERRGGYDHVVA